MANTKYINGDELIDLLVHRVQKKNKLLTDTNILIELRGLSYQEFNEIMTYENNDRK